MNTAEMYRILELEEGASPEAVKKAYFRLIRKYPPETNPQGFQKLREAYEVLKDGTPQPSDEDIIISWKYPMVGILLQQADQYEAEENYEKACRVMEDALILEPDNAPLLLMMARLQMYARHPQKAAMYAETATQKMPDNVLGWTILANAMQYRGWHKKAKAAFQRAYELGCRDSAFLIERVINLELCGEKDGLEDQYRAVIESNLSSDQYSYEIMEGFCHWGSLLSPDPERAEHFLRLFRNFAKRNGTDSEVSHLALETLYSMIHLGNIANIREQIRETVNDLADSGIFSREKAEEYAFTLLYETMDNDPRLKQEEWKELCVCFLDLDPQMIRVSITSAQMSLLEHPEQTRREAEIIRADYPEIAGHYPDLMHALENGDTGSLSRKLTRQFDRLCRKTARGDMSRMMHPFSFERSRGMDRPGAWPEEDDNPAFMDEEAFESPDDLPMEPAQPYVREQEKIGRNDPCPCGSGKKFKKCCMGKGIYD